MQSSKFITKVFLKLGFVFIPSLICYYNYSNLVLTKVISLRESKFQTSAQYAVFNIKENCINNLLQSGILFNYIITY